MKIEFSKHASLVITAYKTSKSKNMVVKYDKESDIIYIQFSENKVVESDEDKPGLILDYGENGDIVGIEVLNA
jgi:uncharacterized protein YuzE